MTAGGEGGERERRRGEHRVADLTVDGCDLLVLFSLSVILAGVTSASTSWTGVAYPASSILTLYSSELNQFRDKKVSKFISVTFGMNKMWQEASAMCHIHMFRNTVPSPSPSSLQPAEAARFVAFSLL